jgi:DNA-binding MarR family transcriptional regulator
MDCRVEPSPQRFLALYDQPGHIIRRAQQFASAAPKDLHNPSILTLPQYSVLFAIGLAPGMEQQEVAAAVFYDPVTTGAILRKLGELNAIRRAASDRSVRGRTIFITPGGEALLAEIAPFTGQNQTRLLQRLDAAERPLLMHLLSKVAGIVNSANPDPDRPAQTNPFVSLYDQPGHVFRRCRQFSAASFDETVGPLGITPPQFPALYAIAIQPGMEQQEIARAIFYDAATTSGILSRLMKIGAIQRVASGRSARGMSIQLTPQGRGLLQGILPMVWQHQVRLLGRLSLNEKPAFLRLMSKVAGIDNSFSP